MSKGDNLVYAADVAMQGLPRPVPEFTFHPSRKWRFDYAWPEYRVALEVEGGIYGAAGRKCQCCNQPMGGAHRAVTGIKRDIEKYSEAASYGWLILRCTPDRLYHAETQARLRKTLTLRGFLPGKTILPKLFSEEA